MHEPGIVQDTIRIRFKLHFDFSQVSASLMETVARNSLHCTTSHTFTCRIRVIDETPLYCHQFQKWRRGRLERFLKGSGLEDQVGDGIDDIPREPHE